jgi:hypothetical protein
MLDLIINFLYAIFFGSQLITGIFLLIRTIKIKQLNLIPLVLFFFLNPLEIVLILFVGTSNIVNIFSNISLLFFIKFTFFRDRKSSFMYLLVSLIIVKILDFSLKLYIPFSIPLNFVVTSSEVPYFYLYLTLTSLSVLLSYPWLGLTALKYYHLIKAREIELWVKVRYKLIGYSSLIITINAILYLFMPIDTYDWEYLNSFIIGLLITINTTIFSIANLFAWVMPKKLKNYFNRHYQATVEENLTEEEIMNKVREDLDKKVE